MMSESKQELFQIDAIQLCKPVFVYLDRLPRNVVAELSNKKIKLQRKKPKNYSYRYGGLQKRKKPRPKQVQDKIIKGISSIMATEEKVLIQKNEQTTPTNASKNTPERKRVYSSSKSDKEEVIVPHKLRCLRKHKEETFKIITKLSNKIKAMNIALTPVESMSDNFFVSKWLQRLQKQSLRSVENNNSQHEHTKSEKAELEENINHFSRYVNATLSNNKKQQALSSQCNINETDSETLESNATESQYFASAEVDFIERDKNVNINEHLSVNTTSDNNIQLTFSSQCNINEIDNRILVPKITKCQYSDLAEDVFTDHDENIVNVNKHLNESEPSITATIQKHYKCDKEPRICLLKLEDLIKPSEDIYSAQEIQQLTAKYTDFLMNSNFVSQPRSSLQLCNPSTQNKESPSTNFETLMDMPEETFSYTHGKDQCATQETKTTLRVLKQSPEKLKPFMRNTTYVKGMNTPSSQRKEETDSGSLVCSKDDDTHSAEQQSVHSANIRMQIWRNAFCSKNAKQVPEYAKPTAKSVEDILNVSPLNPLQESTGPMSIQRVQIGKPSKPTTAKVKQKTSKEKCAAEQYTSKVLYENHELPTDRLPNPPSVPSTCAQAQSASSIEDCNKSFLKTNGSTEMSLSLHASSKKVYHSHLYPDSNKTTVAENEGNVINAKSSVSIKSPKVAISLENMSNLNISMPNKNTLKSSNDEIQRSNTHNSTSLFTASSIKSSKEIPAANNVPDKSCPTGGKEDTQRSPMQNNVTVTEKEIEKNAASSPASSTLNSSEEITSKGPSTTDKQDDDAKQSHTSVGNNPKTKSSTLSTPNMELQSTPSKKNKREKTKIIKVKRPLRVEVTDAICRVCSTDFHTKTDLAEHIFKHTAQELWKSYQRRITEMHNVITEEDPSKNSKEHTGQGAETTNTLNEKTKDNNLPEKTVNKSTTENYESQTNSMERPTVSIVVDRNEESVSDDQPSAASNHTATPGSIKDSSDQLRMKSTTLCDCHKHEGVITNGDDLYIEIILFCDFCQVLFRRSQCLETHYRRPDRQLCKMNRQSGRQAKLLCSACRVVLNSLQELRRHLEMHAKISRSGTVIFICNICKVVFIGVGDVYQTHWENHAKKPFFVASRFSFPKAMVLDDSNYQLEILGPERMQEFYFIVAEYICEHCKVPFAMKDTLVLHEQICSKNKNVINPRSALEKPSTGNVAAGHRNIKLICTLCKQEFLERSQFVTHALQHVKKPRAEPRYICISVTAVQQAFVCAVCAKIYDTLPLLREHWTEHTILQEQFVCTLCEEHSETYESFLQHASNHTDKDELNEGLTCKVIYKQMAFKCMFCNMTFDCQERLNEHIIVHKQDYPQLRLCRLESEKEVQVDRSSDVSPIKNNEDAVKEKRINVLSVLKLTVPVPKKVKLEISEKMREVCRDVKLDRDALKLEDRIKESAKKTAEKRTDEKNVEPVSRSVLSFALLQDSPRAHDPLSIADKRLRLLQLCDSNKDSDDQLDDTPDMEGDCEDRLQIDLFDEGSSDKDYKSKEVCLDKPANGRDKELPDEEKDEDKNAEKIAENDLASNTDVTKNAIDSTNSTEPCTLQQELAESLKISDEPSSSKIKQESEMNDIIILDDNETTSVSEPMQLTTEGKDSKVSWKETGPVIPKVRYIRVKTLAELGAKPEVHACTFCSLTFDTADKLYEHNKVHPTETQGPLQRSTSASTLKNGNKVTLNISAKGNVQVPPLAPVSALPSIASKHSINLLYPQAALNKSPLGLQLVASTVAAPNPVRNILPKTTASTTKQITIPQAITHQVITQHVITQQVLTQQRVTQQPVTQQPVTQQPVTQQPVTQQPVTQQLTIRPAPTQQPTSQYWINLPPSYTPRNTSHNLPKLPVYQTSTNYAQQVRVQVPAKKIPLQPRIVNLNAQCGSIWQSRPLPPYNVQPQPLMNIRLNFQESTTVPLVSQQTAQAILQNPMVTTMPSTQMTNVNSIPSRQTSTNISKDSTQFFTCVSCPEFRSTEESNYRIHMLSFQHKMQTKLESRIREPPKYSMPPKKLYLSAAQPAPSSFQQYSLIPSSTGSEIVYNIVTSNVTSTQNAMPVSTPAFDGTLNLQRISTSQATCPPAVATNSNQQVYFMCSSCPRGMYFTSQQQLMSHMESHHSFMCELCGFRTHVAKDIAVHRVKHYLVGDSVTCQEGNIL